MDFVMRVAMDNDAFFRREQSCDGGELRIRDGEEIARLLRDVADAMGGDCPRWKESYDGWAMELRDINGNPVGSVELTGEY